MNRHALGAILILLSLAVASGRRWLALLALAICVLEIIRQETDRLR